MNDQETINKLFDNPKIIQVCTFYSQELEQYISVTYCDKNGIIHDILVDPDDLRLLLNPFTIVTMRGVPYVRLMLPDGPEYLHRAIARPPQGHVAHHIGHTIDNRRSSLQSVPLADHSRFHRQLCINNLKRTER